MKCGKLTKSNAPSEIGERLIEGHFHFANFGVQMVNVIACQLWTVRVRVAGHLTQLNRVLKETIIY